MGSKTTYTKIAELVVKHNPVRVLDAGCGEGKLGMALRRLKYKGEYFGVDTDEESFDVLQSRRFCGEVCDLRWLDYRHYSQDCVVVKDVTLSRLVVERLMVMTRRWFILSSTNSEFIKDMEDAAKHCSFEPLWDESDLVSHSKFVVYQRRKRN